MVMWRRIHGRRENREHEDKQKERKLYPMGRKLSSIAKFDKYRGNMVEAARDSRVPRGCLQQ